MVVCLEVAKLLVTHHQHLFQYVVAVFESRLFDRQVVKLCRELCQLLLAICQLGLTFKFGCQRHQSKYHQSKSLEGDRTTYFERWEPVPGSQ